MILIKQPNEYDLISFDHIIKKDKNFSSHVRQWKSTHTFFASVRAKRHTKPSKCELANQKENKNSAIQAKSLRYEVILSLELMSKYNFSITYM